VGGILVAVVAVVLVVGFKMLAPPSGKMDTSGSEKLMEQVKQGKPLYQSNAPGIRVPGSPGAGGGAQPGGFFKDAPTR
jgi:hypothetical protein